MPNKPGQGRPRSIDGKKLTVYLPIKVIEYLGSNRSQKLAKLVEDEMKKETRIFKTNEVDPNRPGGWTVDLSTGNAVNPDCYWHFGTRQKAQAFLEAVDAGMDAKQAYYGGPFPIAK